MAEQIGLNFKVGGDSQEAQDALRQVALAAAELAKAVKAMAAPAQLAEQAISETATAATAAGPALEKTAADATKADAALDKTGKAAAVASYSLKEFALEAGKLASQVARVLPPLGEFALDCRAAGDAAGHAKLNWAELGEVASNLSGNLAQVGGMLQGVGASLLAWSGGAVAAAGVSVKAATDMDSLKRSLIAITGSAGEAETQLARLKELAKQPGLGFEEAVQGSIQLQTARMSAQEAERTLKAVAIGVARGGGGRDDLKAVILNLQQVRSAGKLTGDELKETAQRIPELRKILEERLGTSNTESLAKNFKLDQIFEAMVSGLEELQAPVDSARNSFDNLGDAAKQALAAIGDTILPWVADLASQAGAALEQFTAGWKALDPEVKGFIASGAAVAVGLTAISGLAATAAGSALLLVSGLTAAVGALVTFAPAATAALAVLAPFLPVMGGVAAAVGAMVAAATAGAVTLAIAWQQNWGDIQGVTADAVADVRRFVADLVQQIRAEWGEIAAAARETAEALRPALALMGMILNTHWTEFKAVTAATWETIKGAVKSGVELAGSFIREGLAVMRGDWDTALEAMSSRWVNFWSGLGDAVAKGLKRSAEIRAEGFAESERILTGKPRPASGPLTPAAAEHADPERPGVRAARRPVKPLEDEKAKKEREELAKAQARLAAFQADLGVAALPEGSIELRLRKTLEKIKNESRDKLTTLEKLIADSGLTGDAAKAMRTAGRKSIASWAQEERLKAEAAATKERQQAAEAAAKKPVEASRKLLADAEKSVEASVNKLFARLVEERKLSPEAITAATAEERAGGLLLALERFGDQLRPQELAELQKKIADALQAFDQALAAQSTAVFERERSRAELALKEAREGNAGYPELIALTEQFARLLQSRENELRGRDPAAADRMAVERLQKEKEARDLRYERDSGNTKAADQTSEFRRRQAAVEHRDRELTAAEAAAGPVRERFLDPKERRDLLRLQEQIAAKQNEISRLSLGSTPAELLARVKAEEELLELREQVLEITERTAEAERKAGERADRTAEQVREREAQETKAAADREQREREAAIRDMERIAEAAERNDEAERDLARKQRARALGDDAAGRRAFLTDERARLVAEIAEAEARMGRLDPLNPADADAYEQQRGRLTELRKELFELEGDLDRLRPRWEQFWRDLGQSVTESLRSAFSNAFTGLFEGLMGAKGRLNNILGDLLSDVRLTVARALSGTLQEGIESLIRGGIKSIFRGSPSRPKGRASGGSEDTENAERLDTAASDAGAAADRSQGRLSIGEMATAAGLAAGSIFTFIGALNKGKEGVGSAVPAMVAALAQLVLAVMVAKSQIAAGPAGLIAGGVGLLASLFGGKHADGGRPAVGKLNLVGERGPELFVPDVAGEIIPNHKLGRLGLNLPMADVSVAHPRLPAGRLVGGNTTHNQRTDNKTMNFTLNDNSVHYGEKSAQSKREREMEEYQDACRALWSAS